LNLITDTWIPIRRKSGTLQRIAPWQVSERFGDDPVVTFASPRPDFDGSLAQLLVGLLQATLAPSSPAAWRRRLGEPPTPEELRAAFEPLAGSFELLGDGPRVFQDLTLTEDESKPSDVEKLLIDASLHGGRDHFRKGGQVEALCLPCAASALATLQINAPVGGRGHRASPRGGGPLTTLVRSSQSLWTTLWANVLEANTLAELPGAELDRPEDTFPWLAPTRISDQPTKTTTAADVHPLQMYWPMPRRIRLETETADPAVACDLCGEPAQTVVRSYRARHHGVNYTGPWQHPFTPLRKTRDERWIPVQMDTTGLSYRHWLGLVQNDRDLERGPATVVLSLQDRMHGQFGEWRLWTFGYDMDNMKARGWYEGMMEIVLLSEEDKEAFEEEASALVRAARWADWALQAACRQVVIKREPPGKKMQLTAVEARFWQSTEAEFYKLLPRIPPIFETAGEADDEPDEQAQLNALKRHWHRTLRRQASQIFEDWSASGLFDAVDPEQVARAWNLLQGNLWGPKMREALDLADLKTPSSDHEEAA